MKKKIIIAAILIGLCLLDLSVTQSVGASHYPGNRFSNFKGIGSISWHGLDGLSVNNKIKTEGENLSIEILDIEYDIPASMYLPFYRFGYMTASLRFKASDANGNEIIDTVSVEQDVKKYGLFLLPDPSLKVNLDSDLKDTLIKGVETRINENSNQSQ
jgi:hypothetical protein